MHETCENCTTTFSVGLKSCPHCQAELTRSVNDPAPVEHADAQTDGQPSGSDGMRLSDEDRD